MNKILLATALVSLMFVPACNEKPDNPNDEGNNGNIENETDPKYAGLVINEVAAHEDLDGIDTWIELVNPTSETKQLDGLDLYLTDSFIKGRSVSKLSGSLAPGERLTLSTENESLRTGIDPTKAFSIVLGTAANKSVSAFSVKDGENSLGYFGSWQRIPDGTGDFRLMTYDTKDKENKLFNLNDYYHNAVWVWGSHMSDLLDNDAAKLKNLKNLGYDHILLNAAAFDNNNNHHNALRFVRRCQELDLVVHAWIQCFYNNGEWESPVDDENKCYREETYERIRNNANRYLKEWGAKGLHLDYIRFGGTAYKHNPSADVTAIGAVNRCCREIREICDSFDEGMVTSAALMPEANSEYYYGQVPSQMSKWIHILMPMIYRYGGYNMNDNKFRSNSNYFATEAEKGGGVSWSGIQTYDANTKGMTAEQIRADIDLMAETKCQGIVLFRYQLGTFPDVKDLWKQYNNQ